VGWYQAVRVVNVCGDVVELTALGWGLCIAAAKISIFKGNNSNPKTNNCRERGSSEEQKDLFSPHTF
jgi:hypothetical protein